MTSTNPKRFPQAYLPIHEMGFRMHLVMRLIAPQLVSKDKQLATGAVRLPWLYLAGVPKSGTTYVSYKLCNLLGYDHGFPFDYAIDIEHNLDVLNILLVMERRLVNQTHTPGKLLNIDIMLRYGIRPVLIFRDLRDVILSIHDHFYYRDEVPLGPFGRIDQAWFDRPYPDRIRHLILFMLPNLVDWCEIWLENKSRLEHLTLRYEDLNRGPEAKLELFQQILAFYHLSVPEPTLRAQLQTDTPKERERFNKGLTGRWLKEFPPELLPLFDQIAAPTQARLGYPT